MRGLLTLAALGAVVAAAPGAAAAAPPPPACTITAIGKHTLVQSLTVRVSAGCPTSGSLTGRLAFSQFPNLTGAGAFTVQFADRTATLRMPRPFWTNAGWAAVYQDPSNRFSVLATPRRHVFGRGRVTIRGAFRAVNGAVVTWAQTVAVARTRVDLGAVRISATFPGGRPMMIQVRRSRSFCAQGHTCPYGAASNVETSFFPAAATGATMTTSSEFQSGPVFLSGSEVADIVLRDAGTGRVLGRSDVLAVVRAP
ncbi:MAG: hypothetical protein ACXVY5_07820 [Gaiellales bacterium]